jgi:hypothetical protein
MSDPSITAVKTLFAESRNICFFTRCEERLTNPEWKQVNGEVAHIKGERPGSARYDANQPDTERQGHNNLMLLCPRHHKLIDRLEPGEFTVDRLTEMREMHLSHAPNTRWCTDDEAERLAILAIQYYREQVRTGLRIVSAKYGEQESFADVTARIQGLIIDDALRVQVTNQNMGGDSLENVVKRLDIEYEFDGVPFQASFTEGEVAVIGSPNS